MKEKQFKATNLLIILATLSVVLVSASVAGLYFGQDWLRTYKAASYQVSSGRTTKIIDPESIDKIQTAINNYSEYSKTALDLVAPLKDYKNIAQTTINAYASNAGITISNISFSSSSTPVGTSGINPVNITVTINNPVSIDRLLKFMKAIESNLPKMQLTGINLSRSESNGNMVNAEPLTIEMYAR